jgi:hypothetical protein
MNFLHFRRMEFSIILHTGALVLTQDEGFFMDTNARWR